MRLLLDTNLHVVGRLSVALPSIAILGNINFTPYEYGE